MRKNPSNSPAPQDPSEWPLDGLELDTEGVSSGKYTLTREQLLVLGWLIANRKTNTYNQMARDCNLNLSQCMMAVLGLMEEELIRLR